MEQEQVEEIEEKGLATRDFFVRNEEATGSIPASSTNFNHLQTPKIQPVTLLSHLTQPWPKFVSQTLDPIHFTNTRSRVFRTSRNSPNNRGANWLLLDRSNGT